MNHYRLVKGIHPEERIVEKIDNCKGGHCVTWWGTYEHKFTKWRCIRCGKFFYQSSDSLNLIEQKLLG